MAGGAVAFVISAMLELDKKEFNDGLKEASNKAQQFGKDFEQSGNKVKKGLQDSTKEAQTFGSKFQSICSKAKTAFAAIVGAAVIKQAVTGLKGLADETASYGDNIDKMSQKLGMSRKAYQEWGYILEKNGSSVDGLGRAMKTINTNVENFTSASDDTKKAYAELGLTMSSLSTMDTDTRLEKIVTAFQKMEDGAAKDALAVKIFGASAQELMPLLNSSAEDTDALREEMERLGLYMSDDAITASAHYQDTMTKLNAVFGSVKRTVGAIVLPVIDKWADAAAEAVGRLNKAYQEGGVTGLVEEFKDMMLEIKLPTLDEIVGKVAEWWGKVTPELAGVLSAVFGIDTPTVENALGTIGDFASLITDGAENLLKFAINLIGGDVDSAKENADAFFDDVLGIGRTVLSVLGVSDENLDTARQSAEDFLGSIQTVFHDLNAGLGVDTSDIDKAVESATKFFTSIYDSVSDILKFTLGIELPKIEDIKKQVNEWILGLGKIGYKLFGGTDEEWDEMMKLSQEPVDPLEQAYRERRSGLKTTENGSLIIQDAMENNKLNGMSAQQYLEGVDAGTIKLKAEIEEESMQELEDGLKDNPKDQPVNVPLAPNALNDLQDTLNSTTLSVPVEPEVISFGSNPYANASSVDSNGHGGGGRRFGENNASGTWRVPYTGYTRVLGKDEAVLTRIQAQEWRAGQTSGGNGSEMDYGRLASVVASAVQRAVSSVQATVSGNQIAGFVSDYMTDSLRYGGVAL